ncbi:molybdopterin molybdotransferase MoeA [soil metagenome]
MRSDLMNADWVTVEEARNAALQAVGRLGTEERPLADCLGRVLAEAVISPIDLPRWNNSAMDGFAVRSSDVAGATAERPVHLPVVDDIAAGAFPRAPLSPGKAARVMTGAAVPAGADSVIRVEHTDGGAGFGTSAPAVSIFSDEDSGRNVRAAGEDLREGQQILSAGRVLSAGDLGVAASIGMASLPVVRRPVVGVLATGDELVDLVDFDEVRAGRRIVSSNSYTLAAQLREAGFEARILGIARDTRESIREHMECARGCDALITSAGVSVGEHDHVRDVLGEMGLVGSFWRVKMRPGSPFAFGLVRALDGIPWFGLPGNPVSSMVTMEVLARPVLLSMAGHTKLHHPVLPAKLLDSFTAQAGLTHFLRVTLHQQPGGGLHARLTGPQGSGMLSSMAAAEALLAVEGQGAECRGDTFPALILGGWPLQGEPG